MEIPSHWCEYLWDPDLYKNIWDRSHTDGLSLYHDYLIYAWKGYIYMYNISDSINIWKAFLLCKFGCVVWDKNWRKNLFGRTHTAKVFPCCELWCGFLDTDLMKNTSDKCHTGRVSLWCEFWCGFLDTDL